MNDLFMQYFQSFISLLDLVLMFQSFTYWLIFHVLPGLFKAKTAKLMQSNHLVSCFFPLFVFLTPYLEYKLVEGRKGLSENLYDICDLLLIAGTEVPAGHKPLPVLGNVLMLC